MKGNPKVLELLNEILTAELTAINQYFLHSEMCEAWGYERLHKSIRGESMDEMRHADELIDRILQLDGSPAMNRLFELRIGKTVPEMLSNDLRLEQEAVARLNDAIRTCREEGDNGSAELLDRILSSEEEHLDWIEAQLTQIEQMGIENYLATQVHGDG